MKALIDNKDGYISVEAAIITGILLILIALGIMLVIRRYGITLNYTSEMSEEAEAFNEGGFGDTLRIAKVLEELGNRVMQ